MATIPIRFRENIRRTMWKNTSAMRLNDFIDFKAEILLKEAGNDPIKKAEAIRDIVKSVAFVQNSLKQEVYLKEVSNKFGLTEQSLFNELNIQKQVKDQNYRPTTKPEAAPKTGSSARNAERH